MCHFELTVSTVFLNVGQPGPKLKHEIFGICLAVSLDINRTVKGNGSNGETHTF